MPSINIFLGGSGKFVAEELRGNAKLMGNTDERDSWIVLDVDASSDKRHSGAFDLGDEQVLPAAGFEDVVKSEILTEWQKLDYHDGPIPPERAAGADLGAEYSILWRAAQDGVGQTLDKGLWGFRASGLAAFEAFFFRSKTGPARIQRVRFEKMVEDAVAAAGPAAQIHLVTSTAGGTGAGLFLPLALWLKSRSSTKHLPIVLIAVLPSAFEHEAPEEGESIPGLRSKGYSGSYAIARELDLLSHHWGKGPQLRRLPIGSSPGDELRRPLGQLPYRTGETPFRAVVWVGMRQNRSDEDKADVYGEIVPLLQALATADYAEAFRGGYPDGPLPQFILSAVTAGYPRLRAVSGSASEVVESTIANLLSSPAKEPPSQWQESFPGRAALRIFLRDPDVRRSFRFDGAPEARRSLRIQPLTSLIDGFDSEDVSGHFRTERLFDPPSVAARLGFTDGDDAWERAAISDADRWERAVEALNEELSSLLQVGQHNVPLGIEEIMREESAAFRSWIENRIDRELNPERGAPTALNHVLEQLLDVQRDLAGMRQFFEAGEDWRDGDRLNGPADEDFVLGDEPSALPDHLAEAMRLPSEASERGWARRRLHAYRYRTEQDLESLSNGLVEELRNRQEPPKPGWTTWVPILAALLGFAIGGLYTWAESEPLLTVLWRSLAVAAVLGVVAVGAVAYILGRSRDARHGAHLRGIERLLRELCVERMMSVGLPALYRAFRSGNAKTGFIGFVSSAEADIETAIEHLATLERVLDQFEKRALARKQSASTGQAHETYTILPVVNGQLQYLRPNQRSEAQTRLSGQLRFRGMGLFERGLVLNLRRQDDSVNEIDVLDADLGLTNEGSSRPDYQEEIRKVREFDRALDLAARDILSEGDAKSVPATLEAALHAYVPGRESAEIRTMVGSLFGLDANGGRVRFPRTGASSSGAGGEMVRARHLIAPSAAEFGLLRDAVQSDATAIGDEFRSVSARGVNYVSALGSMVGVITLFTAHDPVTGAVEEIQGAGREYYYKDPEKGEFSQRIRNFHVLPECAAAAEIEIREASKGVGVARPLHVAVVARLAGSDLKTPGPKLLGLFYHLRSEQILVQEPMRGEFGDRVDYRLRVGNEDVLLLSEPKDLGDAKLVFGKGEGWVRCFDRLEAFLAYRGGQVEEPLLMAIGSDTQQTLLGWVAMSTARLHEVQRSLVRSWFDARKVAQTSQSLGVLNGDRLLFEQSEAGPDWLRAVEQILRAEEQG